jgi:hypothetical protein
LRLPSLFVQEGGYAVAKLVPLVVGVLTTLGSAGGGPFDRAGWLV